MQHNPLYLSEVRQALPSQWKISTDSPMWLYATAPDNPTAIQEGWKVHVSSQVDSAVQTLRETIKVCVKHRVAFKLAITPEILSHQINSKQRIRSAVNKFMTLYPSPDDPERLTRLINELNEVLTALDAPIIFTDVRVGRQTWIRYGAFRGIPVLQPDGTSKIMIQDPDGNVVEDKRSAFFDPPTWVNTHPITGKPLEDPSDDDNAAINGYTVQSALHFSATGGVYLANDENNDIVVLKEAIPNAMYLNNQDAVGRLAAEYEILEHLAETRYTPKPVDLFTYQTHKFLAMEYLSDFQTLSQSAPLPLRDALPIATAIAEAVKVIHSEDVVVGDLSDKNVLLSKNGGVKIIDFEGAYYFEGAYHTESPSETLFATAGFAAQHRLRGPTDDVYSLGAVLTTLFIGRINGLYDLASKPAVVAERFFSAAGMPKELTRLITECLSDAPATRPTASEIAFRLSTLQHHPTRHSEDTKAVDGDGDIDRTFNTLTQLVAETSFPRPSRTVSEGSRLGIASGIAGFTLTLNCIREDTQSDPTVAERFNEGRWQLLEADLDSEKFPPGFANGLAGIAFAIHRTTEAATQYAETLMKRALEHPMLEDPSFPLTGMHGRCGIGLTALYFYKQSGNPSFLEGAVVCAQRLEAGVDAGAVLLFFALADAMRGEGREADAHFWCMRGRECIKALAEADKPKSGMNAQIRDIAVTKSKQYFGDEFLSAFAMDAWEFSKDFMPDSSLAGGLSGVGLAYLHRYETTGETTHLISAMEIAKTVACFIYENENGNGPAFPGADLRAASVGLFSGASGAILFLQRLREQPSPTPFFPWEWL